MSNERPGDTVRIKTDTEEFEGILIKRPEILGGDFTVLKLESGYNQGIDNRKIKEIRVKEKYSPKPAKKRKAVFNRNLPTVSILSTGGTISSRVDYRTGGVYADYTAEDFIGMMPELAGHANLKVKKIMGVMSEDIRPEDWAEMAKHIEKELNAGADGVVVTHGTDTLHFTSSALSFFLQDVRKPVIITGAQRSIDRGSSDAYMNLACSVIAASRFDGAGVMTCLHGTTNDDFCLLIRGTKVRKMATSRRDAFRPIGELPLAKVFADGHIEILSKEYEKRGEGKAKVNCSFEKKVALVYAYPGMDPEIIDFYIRKGYKGIVIAATALGHVPTLFDRYSLIENLKKAAEKNVHVVISSQTLYGRVHPYVYTNLRKLSVELGCIFVEDMLPETAYVKLGWVLARTDDAEKAREMMQKSIAGEMTERSLPSTFLY